MGNHPMFRDQIYSPVKMQVAQYAQTGAVSWVPFFFPLQILPSSSAGLTARLNRAPLKLNLYDMMTPLQVLFPEEQPDQVYAIFNHISELVPVEQTVQESCSSESVVKEEEEVSQFKEIDRPDSIRL